LNRYGTNGALDFASFEAVLHGLGTVDQGKIQ
jgi:hypothetical protein